MLFFRYFRIHKLQTTNLKYNPVKLNTEFHNESIIPSTKIRRLLILIYFEGCLNQQDATRRENYLKSGNRKIDIKNRLHIFFNPTRLRRF